MVRIFLTVFLMIIPKKGVTQDIVNICNHVNRQNKIPLKITGSSINVTTACSCLVQSDGINVSIDSVQLYGSQQNISMLTIMDVNLYVFPEKGSSIAVDGEFIVYNRSNGLRSFKMDSFIIIWNPVSGKKSSTFEVILSANSSSYFDMLCIKHGRVPWFAWLNLEKMQIPSMQSRDNTRQESLDGGVVAGAFIGGLVLGLLLIAGAVLGYRYWKCWETPSPVRSVLKRLSLTKSAEKMKDYGQLGSSVDHRGIDRANKSVSCRTTKNVTLYSPESPPVIQIQEKDAPNGQRRGKSTRNPNMPVEIRNLALYRNVSEENLVEEDRIQYREGKIVGSVKKEMSKPTHNEDLDVPDNASSSIETEEEDIEQSKANLANVFVFELTGSRENNIQIDHFQQKELTIEGISPGEQNCAQKPNEMNHAQNHLVSEREGIETQENSDDRDLHFPNPLYISASEGLEQIPSQDDTNENDIVLKASDSDACYDNKGLDDNY
ncbi:hypothetical protein CHS0354_032237 [Potamilus streckersoni]|uniref:Uncharacterized protein n=1 Tax=Potamilus streckersoni TaxID=2493646 RepID=A0AAE0RPV8_9BIVA|nr:hypothetical protein CHS0354_032237 [Potamilus streckersoni]